MGNITAWNPRISYQFLSNLNMIGSTQTTTIFAVAELLNRFVNPPLDCDGSICNTIGVQAGYNQEKGQGHQICIGDFC